MVESQPSKLLVASSSLVSRSLTLGILLFKFFSTFIKADVAQLVEHILGKDEVTGSNPVVGSTYLSGKIFSLIIENKFIDQFLQFLTVGGFSNG